MLRLALIYCLLDRRALIDVEHLRAALAAWHYCDRSAAYLFGEHTGDQLADRFLERLRQAPGGLTRTQLREIAGSDRPVERIETALELLPATGSPGAPRSRTPADAGRALVRHPTRGGGQTDDHL